MIPKSYRPRMRPRQHQLEAALRVRAAPMRPSDKDVFAYLMEMGTGKSKVVLDEWGERVCAGDLDDLLVVAPAGCYRNWFQDRGPDYPSEMRKMLDPELFAQTMIGSWQSGGSFAHKRSLDVLLNYRGPRALFVNVEALSSVENAVKLCERFMEDRRCMMVIDESTVIKNYKSERTEVCDWLGQMATARRIMTGLVTPNSPLDIFSQFSFLDYRILGFKAYHAFRARYAVIRDLEVGGQWNPRKVKVVVNYQHVKELYQKISPYSFRKLKVDCLDLPPKQYMPIREVELTDDQRRIYNSLRDTAQAQLDAESYVSANMVITQRLRMDQVLCGYTVDEEGDFHEIKENRTRSMLEFVEDAGGKGIIWTTWDPCVHKITAALRKAYGDNSVAQFWGGNASTRHFDESRFKQDKECRFMVSTPAAGGRGNTWTMANWSLYYNNSDNLEHRMQSEDRTHRDGLTHAAIYQDLVARETIDEKKIKNLRRKLDLSSIVTGDNYREWLI